MYQVRVYNVDDVLEDIAGNFESEDQADEWIRDYVDDNHYAVIKEVFNA